MHSSEFLKGATVRSHKIFQRLRKIWVFERENAQFITVLPFWVFFFVIFRGVLPYFDCAKLSDKNFRRAKKLLLESLALTVLSPFILIKKYYLHDILNTLGMVALCLLNMCGKYQHLFYLLLGT